MTKRSLLLIGVFFITSSIVFVLSAFSMQFQVALNDFWTVFYYARNMTLAEPASLQNSLFPVGYAAILGAFPVQHAVRLAFLLNSALVSLFIAATSALALSRQSYFRAGLVFLVGLFFPLVFRYGNTTGPDIGTAAWIAVGLYFLWHNHLETEQPTRPGLWQDVLAGLAFGLATLWRSHGAAAALVILTLYALFYGPKNIWQRKSLLLVFLAISSIQGLVNLFAGVSFFESAQYLNLYKTFYGNDWYAFPQGGTNALFIELLTQNPLHVIKVLWPYYWSVAQYAWPGLALFFVAHNNPNLRKYALFVALAIALYAGPVSFGSSPRAPLPILALAFTAFGFLCTELIARLKTTLNTRPVFLHAGLGLAIIVFGYYLFTSFQTNLDFVQSYAHQHETYSGVERKLRDNGLASPNQVFTTSFNFYLPYMAPHQPRFNGGWDVVIMYKFRQENPELPVTSWQDFEQACREQGIRFLVLTPYSDEAAEFLGEIYAEKYIPNSLQKIGKRGNHLMLMFLDE